MKKFQTMGELALYLLRANAPNELKNAATENMQAVEETNHGGAEAYLIIAETKAEAKQVEREYALSNCTPECSKIINTLDGAYWFSRTMVAVSFISSAFRSWTRNEPILRVLSTALRGDSPARNAKNRLRSATKTHTLPQNAAKARETR